ncbi:MULTISPECIES: hypothetical protein [unclassified Acinetobacter]|uniref:hypothetical protein n=1 Tax=unclassified Acinetobacter TaxID=196816 RepID=UPI002448B5AF|nr:MULTISPECIES: hypothetical protein [unclassified Acinetobacter]MDH0029701.1 hypothetical protein [Acinetobacter sp. GD04021]MDH0885535.1 hypothetical protein [Acinetobacter sp. GD03873]MDH1081653.1 hypothetical protein [Acinetobacter sp. GD03983]MDH2188566.1 hypothetical protein [Acinetobacter sp. GD03645]MDH2203920.1 hypothetical protein [Acinetobacter sp. GD03647]
MMSTYQTENSRLLWMIIGGISVVVVLFLAVQWFLAQKDQQSTSTQKQPVAAKPVATVKQQTTVTPEPTAVSSEVAEPIQLVKESIIKEPLPANDSLAKEEIAKLDDIHQQLKDQQQELKQQHDDVDALLKLKEEQVKLLEAQIAAQK